MSKKCKVTSEKVLQPQNYAPQAQEVKKQYTVFVPADYDVILKVVPSKEFFDKVKKEDNESILNEFGLDDRSLIETSVRFKVEAEYANRLDFLAYKLPVNTLKTIARLYMIIRNIKGSIDIKEGFIFIHSNGKTLNLRLDHILKIICSAPSKEHKEFLDREWKNTANYCKKIAKTSKIDAVTRKGF